ncbi:PepSY-associated TM helix domain-containing protein [Nonomuraea indica]|uniref:PepSY-associated TM helix domain-containing protein n=1 Tax=Nonomuraea indica TaxID=1581193 RepID=UPI000C7D63BA|nr:PepSY domain-containing protein [Nonomuraea indica]
MSSTLETGPTTEPEGSPTPRGGSPAALRPLVLRLHFYAGVLVGPFLLVAAVTGLLYAVSWQVEKIVYSHELYVPAKPATVPLSQQVAAARATQPGGTVTSVKTPAEPGRTTAVLMEVPGLAPSTKLAVFVDPHTAEVRGTLESYGGSGALPVRAWISHLHRDLHLGEAGRIYSELAASWLWVVALGGVLLWLSRRRRPGRRLRRLLAPEPGTTGRRRSLSWHGAVGLWAVAGLLFLSATGLTWSAYAGENVSDLRAALDWSTPSLSSASGGGDHSAHLGTDHAAHSAHGTPPGAVVDRVAGAAAGAGLSGPLEIVWPDGPGGAYVVKEIDNVWPQRLDQVAVDPATARVTEELRFADHPPAAKLARWGIDGHMGVLFGPANQLLLVVLAAGLVFLVGYGYRMWWQRRPTRGFGPPYRRGAWRRARWAVLAPSVVLAVAAGWFMPLLGVSLAAFLLVDVLLGLRARAASKRATSSPA